MVTWLDRGRRRRGEGPDRGRQGAPLRSFRSGGEHHPPRPCRPACRRGPKRILAWTRDPEAEVLPLCEELGIGFVPWGPLGTGQLTGKVARTSSFDVNDFRARSPRFTPEAMEANQAVVEAVEQLAAAKEAPRPRRWRSPGSSQKGPASCRSSARAALTA